MDMTILPETAWNGKRVFDVLRLVAIKSRRFQSGLTFGQSDARMLYLGIRVIQRTCAGRLARPAPNSIDTAALLDGCESGNDKTPTSPSSP